MKLISYLIKFKIQHKKQKLVRLIIQILIQINFCNCNKKIATNYFIRIKMRNYKEKFIDKTVDSIFLNKNSLMDYTHFLMVSKFLMKIFISFFLILFLFLNFFFLLIHISFSNIFKILSHIIRLFRVRQILKLEEIIQ